MSWEAPVPIFEDENEDELIDEFVRLSAKYGKGFSPAEIAHEVFKNLRDPYPRAHQAAMQWGGNLAIRRRIDEARLNGECGEPLTRSQLAAKMLAVAEDPTIDHRDKAEQIKGYQAYAKLMGWEKEGEDGPVGNNFPTFVFGIDPRSVNAS